MFDPKHRLWFILVHTIYVLEQKCFNISKNFPTQFSFFTAKILFIVSNGSADVKVNVINDEELLQSDPKTKVAK